MRIFQIAKMAWFFAYGLLLMNVMHVSAATINVKLDGTRDFTSIQSAINASAEGDTIMVYNQCR